MRRFVQFAVTYIRNIFSIIFYGFVHGARSLVVQPTRVYLCPRLHQYRHDKFNGSMDELYVGTDLVTRPRDLYDRLLECIMQNDARKVHDILCGDKHGILRHNRGEHSRENDTFPLLLATMLGNAKIVSLLLAGGVDPNYVLEGSAFHNTRSPTALHQAVEDGHLEIVKILTRQSNSNNNHRCKNAHIDIQNCDGETALHIAVEDGTFEMVNALLMAGCNVNVLDSQGNNALHVALSSNRCSAAVIKALVAYGVDINFPNCSGITPARYAALTGNLPAVAILLAAGCQLKFNLEGSLSPLEAAIIQQDIGTVQAILSSQKILNSISDPSVLGTQQILLPSTHLSDSSAGTTHFQFVDESLHFGARYGNSEIMNVLLRYKSNCIDEYNSQGETPLFVAVRYNNVQTLKILLDQNANANKTSLHGISCLCKATLDCNFILVLYLVIFADVDYGLEMNSAAIHKALFCGFHNIGTLLIQCGCTLNNSALHLVLSSKDWALMPLIHEAGYDYFARTVAIQMVKHERKVNAEIFDWAISVLSGPNSLQHQCRVVIRNTIRGQLYAKVQTLNLPKVMKEYLMLGPIYNLPESF